ncbi:electron transport complex subunit E [Suttonella ornithocola]|uniref:Ion-translocating oxidoreductase complex subunit E n=1 Tax=Suttonella ornithocola TaxID=279832 RepID=A0A380MTK8_9GAMM|nr:electron transport complex subunit E [Suttonella ornithocola]SUO95608.1 Electron transport complex protein rnfE [Suttonella ornithocola]
MNEEAKKLINNGLWSNNPALVQILGLCPLLAVSNTVVNALGLGLATIFVMGLSNVLVSGTKQWLKPEIRIPVFVLLIASAVTLCQLLIEGYLYPLYQSLGIYLPLIVTNCAIIARAEAYAVKNPIKYALLDGVVMGLGFALVLLMLGAMREVLANGTLFSGADILFGSIAKNWEIQVVKIDMGIILAALPAGAFICYGLLIAGKNMIDALLERRCIRHRNAYNRPPGVSNPLSS